MADLTKGSRSTSRPVSRSSKGSAKRASSLKRVKSRAKPISKGKTKSTAKEEEPPAVTPQNDPELPEDIFPLVLTSKTQEIFHCRTDQDVTQDNPYSTISKEEILHDMRTRGAVSDFYPVKQHILDYPGESLLLVFDRDFKYGQNFYLVLTEEAKERILNPPTESADEGDDNEVLEASVYKPPVPKPWVSFGSEKEIKDESFKEFKKQIKVIIFRLKTEFGAPVNFSDHNASDVKDGYNECTSYDDKKFSIKQLEKDTGTQAVPVMKEASSQTKWVYPRNACTQYEPREFTEEEKKELLTSKQLKEFINSVVLRIEIALQQNEIMDAFLDHWKALTEEESTFGGKSDTHLKEYQSFTDLHGNKERTVSHIGWHPTIHGIIAVALTERLTFEERINLSAKLILTPSLILIWSFADPLHAKLQLECPDDVYCFQFCPSDPNIIAGGCINGQVVLWDLSAYAERLQSEKTGHGKQTVADGTTLPGIEAEHPTKIPTVRYCAVSSIEHGHRAIITDIYWLPEYYEVSRMGIPHENKNGICVQFVTCSPDGSILFWDIRPPKVTAQSMLDKKKAEEKQLKNPHGVPSTFKHLDLTWKPIMKVTLPKTDSSGEYSPVVISIRDDQEFPPYLVKPEKPEAVDYSALRVPSARNLKLLENINTKFFVGTEDGELIYSDWKMEKDGDSGKLISSKPNYKFAVHDGILHTVQRSPFFKDIILTVGGWTFTIWKEGVTNGPILQSACSPKMYTAAHWSLSRAGIFFLGKEDGNIDIWDLLEKTHEPSQTQNISTAPVTCIKPWIVTSKQHLLAVADDYGTLHILQIPWTLRHPSSHERLGIQHYFEREVKRLDYFAERKIFCAKEKMQMEAEEQRKKNITAPPEKSEDQIEDEMKKEYESYLSLEKKMLFTLGMITESEEKTQLAV